LTITSPRSAGVFVLERSAVACAASGKFLALDLCNGTPLMAVTRRSFALHTELAEVLGGDEWGYRRVTTYAGLLAFLGSDMRSRAGVGFVGRRDLRATGIRRHDGESTSRRFHDRHGALGGGVGGCCDADQTWSACSARARR
jgi:hypothetical protein